MKLETWIGGNGITRNLTAAFYNTTDRNNADDSMNTCPQELWDKIDAEEFKKKFDVFKVFNNGPRHWCYDWAALPVGKELEFSGLKARWFGQVDLPKNTTVGEKGGTAYKSTQVHRASKQGYNKGTTAFILTDPQGTIWVMQAYSLTLDKSLTWEGLKMLEQKLKLPSGWSYRFTVLEKGLQISAINGIARVVQDDLENTYNALFEEGGQTNYPNKP